MTNDVLDGERARYWVREAYWWTLFELERPSNVFVRTNVLYWLNWLPLHDLLQRYAHRLLPGGVSLNGDHRYEGDNGPRLDELAKTLSQRRARRVGVYRTEDWRAWWHAIEQAPEWAALVQAGNGGFGQTIYGRPTIDVYVRFLRAAGFQEAGILWQASDDRVVAGIR